MISFKIPLIFTSPSILKLARTIFCAFLCVFVYKILKNLSDYRFFIYFLIQHDFNINFLFSLSSIYFYFLFYFFSSAEKTTHTAKTKK